MTKIIVDQAFLDANPGLVAEIGEEVEIHDGVQPGDVNGLGSEFETAPQPPVPGPNDPAPGFVPNLTGENEVNTDPLPGAEGVVNTAEEVVNEVVNVKQNKYQNKIVITEDTREVEGKLFHVLRLEDGSTHDLTEADYEVYVEANK